jgi:hypothetical protein
MIGLAAVVLLLVGALPAAGRDSVGVVDQDGMWMVTDPVTGGRLAYLYGNPSDVPFVGDWDCDGVATSGLYRRSTGQAFLRNSNSTGPADVTFRFGNPGVFPLAGDFDGDGCDSLSIYRPGDASVHLIHRLGSDGGGLGPADRSYVFGNPGDVPTQIIPMVPREGWGARPADTGRMVPHTISRLTLHHAGTQRTTTGPPQYRGWQDWHMSGQGWPDLAYHVIIGVDGTVYEGRDPAFRGDTGTSYDTTGHFLVVVEGDFEIDHPSPAQLDSLAAVLAWASEHYGVSPGTISGHGDHAATLCPGAHLETFITTGELQSTVQTLIDDGGVGLDWP